MGWVVCEEEYLYGRYCSLDGYHHSVVDPPQNNIPVYHLTYIPRAVLEQ